MDKNEEKGILKAITVLGFTQVCNICVSVARSKVVSILLGAKGMGIMSLYQSTSDIISTVSNMGISTTSVKLISEANSKGDVDSFKYLSAAYLKLVRLTGLVAATICCLLSPLLSFINFGDYKHTLFFILLSLSLLGLQFVSGYTSLLQGCRQFKKLSIAVVTGNLLGLVICIPLYYLFREGAIVPVFVVVAFINCLLLRRNSMAYRSSIEVSYKEAIVYGKDVISKGVFICLQSLFALVYIYLIRLYLTHHGGLEVVGYYTAAMAIVNSYIGLVFSSLGTEYYTRLSACDDNSLFVQAVADQIKRTVTLLAPLLVLLIIFIPFVIQLLYTKEFLCITKMCILLLGSIGFKVFEWCIGYAFLSKGKTRVLFFNELSFKIYTLILSLIMYNILGLIGIGTAYLISEFVFCVQSVIVAKKQMNVSINKRPLVFFVLINTCIIVSVFVNLLIHNWIGFLLSIISLILLSCNLFYYFNKLRK